MIPVLAIVAAAGIVVGPDVADAVPVTSVRTVGGGTIDSMRDVIQAPNGDAIVVGTFGESATLTGKAPAPQLTSVGGNDGFVARYDAAGALLWVRQISGSGSDLPLDVELDANGNIYVAGNTESTMLAVGGGVPAAGGGIGRDGFVARYGADGTPAWLRRVTGNGDQHGEGIAVSGDRVYVAGWSEGTAQVTLTNPGGATISSTPVGNFDHSVLGAFTLAGTPSFLRLGGGNSTTKFYDVAATPIAVVAAGQFLGDASFSGGGSTVATSTAGGLDGLVVAYSTNGTPAWAGQVGAGGTSDRLTSVTIDGTRAYVAGEVGDTAGIVTARDLLTGSSVFSQPLPGNATVEDLATGPDGTVLATGGFSGTVQVAMASGAVLTPTANGYDIFVAGIDPVAGGYLAFQRDGGSGSETGYGIAATPAGAALVVGMFSGSVTFTGNLVPTVAVGNNDGFFAKYPVGPAFHGVTPARVLDTRDGTGGAATKIGPGQTRTVKVTGVGGVPATGVSSVAVNVTAVGGSAASHLTVWGTGPTKPTASNLNFSAGQTVPNLVVSRVGTGGTISIFNNSGNVDVIADVVGWYDRDGSGSRFAGVTPVRLLDTRDGTGGSATPFGAATTRELAVTNIGGVPSNATAVVLNVTATGATAATHVTVWPTGVTKPTASNLNVVAGQTVPNLVVVKVGSGGKVSLFNNSGNVHLIADVVGYFTPSPVDGQLRAALPVRVLDTRDGTGGFATPFGAGQTRTLTVAGTAGVPSTARAVVLNVTVTGPTAASHLTVWPGGAAQPTASNLNMAAGQTVANLVMVKLGPNGEIQLRNNSGNVHVIADVVGFYG